MEKQQITLIFQVHCQVAIQILNFSLDPIIKRKPQSCLEIFSDRKASMHFHISNTSVDQKFKIDFSATYMFDNNQLPARDLTNAIGLAPNAPPVFNNDGSLNWMLDANGRTTWENPLAYIKTTYENKTSNLIGSATIRYKILQGLEFRTSIGYNKIYSDEILMNPGQV